MFHWQMVEELVNRDLLRELNQNYVVLTKIRKRKVFCFRILQAGMRCSKKFSKKHLSNIPHAGIPQVLCLTMCEERGRQNLMTKTTNLTLENLVTTFIRQTSTFCKRKFLIDQAWKFTD